MKTLATLATALLLGSTHAQVLTNISCTSAEAAAAMRGEHDPADYAASEVIDAHDAIICDLRSAVHADSLKAYLMRMDAFGTRHTYSDTVSNTTGIGAARRWAFGKFQEFSAANEGRLIPAYLQFDYPNTPGSCGPGAAWRNVLAVLPGSNTTAHGTILIEAHFDSRCADNCDPACYAPGAEDNGSGSALVLELARVMSRYTFAHTLVFMLTTGEEHGLLGAAAMAQYCSAQGIPIKGVLNNDVIGGILCGETSSPPSCAGPGAVDSLQVRIFSDGNANAGNRGMARTIKMYYQEKLQAHVPVPMNISIMEREDRVGRGGDHIPFRQAGYRSVRFTAANEHGNGNPVSKDYQDRQHTETDVLGVDTDGDLVVDSFFVDFNYLQRNAVINGVTATLLSQGPASPSFELFDEPAGLRIAIAPQAEASAFRVGVRGLNANSDFDALYRTTDLSFPIPGLQANRGYYISVAAIDANGIMSPFSNERIGLNDADTPAAEQDALPYAIECAAIGIGERTATAFGALLLPCRPNPSSTGTTFAVEFQAGHRFQQALIVVHDALGRERARIPLPTSPGLHTRPFDMPLAAGVYPYSLVIDGQVVAVRSLVLEGW